MGSTALNDDAVNMEEDHPHIHGEHSPPVAFGIPCQGSPPYTWGAPGLREVGGHQARITPIYMGSTSLGLPALQLIQDHPHIHGEHMLQLRPDLSVRGSPPYTWGAPSHSPCGQLKLRITPIYMGSTGTKRHASVIIEDHPHIHGEHRSNRRSLA